MDRQQLVKPQHRMIGISSARSQLPADTSRFRLSRPEGLEEFMVRSGSNLTRQLPFFPTEANSQAIRGCDDKCSIDLAPAKRIP